MSLAITGYYETSGTGPHDYAAPIPVTRIGNKLYDTGGHAWAVLDSYGDWVSPSMHSLGLKSKQHVISTAKVGAA